MADFFDLKADLEALFAPLSLRFEPSVHPALHPGRSANVLIDKGIVGYIGELHPRLQQKLDLPLAPVLFEVDVGALVRRHVPVYREISRFPAVVRDIALLVKHTVSVQSLVDVFQSEAVNNSACRIMQHIVLFDEYRGKGLAEDEKSLAFRMTMQDTESTLQDASVDVAVAALVDAVHKKFGAILRK